MSYLGLEGTGQRGVAWGASWQAMLWAPAQLRGDMQCYIQALEDPSFWGVRMLDPGLRHGSGGRQLWSLRQAPACILGNALHVYASRYTALECSAAAVDLVAGSSREREEAAHG